MIKIKRPVHKPQDYEKEYKKYSDLELEQLAISLVNTISSIKDNKELKDIELRMKMLKKEIDKRQYEQYIPPNDNILYPEIMDPDFNIKIYKKKEFNQNKIISDSDPDKLFSSSCNPERFNLLPTQLFLKNFISKYTPYNGVLIFHGTGVGKTCSAVTIAEQFKSEIKPNKNIKGVFSKKINVLLSGNIQKGFMNNIFNIDKFIKHKEEGLPISLQCTGNKYFDELGDIGEYYFKQGLYEQLGKKIKKIILSYYNFMGYREFANQVTSLENEIIRGHPKENHEYIKKMFRKELFSDSIMIIDEVHHIRESGDNSDAKIVPPILKRVINDAENMKLILMSATPMFNISREIVDILNLLLLNDKRPLLSASDIFKGEELTEKGRTILIRYGNGYISYLRGENPYEFPNRLYPKINNDPNVLEIQNIPFKKMNGKSVKEKKRIKYLNLIGSVMKDEQLSYYTQYIISNKMKKESAMDQGITYTNIVYPGILKSGEYLNGKEGFEGTFEGNEKTGFKYKKNIISEYGEFLTLDILDKFSTKYKNIINYINNSEGIIYIYSRYIYDGILPLALALEQNGYTRYQNTQLLNSGNKLEYKGSYIMITGGGELSSTKERDISDCINSSNKDGEKIKIVLGTQASGEGIDFHNIREVHILEPWFHLNTLEQAIGRGVRYCSHIDLPFNKRNVTIYQHVTLLSDKYSGFETVDIYRYRKAEEKAIKMSEVERLLKQIAIDCHLNKMGNTYLKSVLNYQTEIITSQKNKTIIELGDTEYSRICDYSNDCEYNCIPDNEEQLDMEIIDSFDIIEEKLYDQVTEILKILYNKDIIYDLNQIQMSIQQNLKIDNKTLSIILNRIIDNPNIIIEYRNRPGYIIYRNIYYIWQPLEYDKSLNIYDRYKKPKKQIHKSSLLNIININKTPEIIDDIWNEKIQYIQEIYETEMDINLKKIYIRICLDNLSEIRFCKFLEHLIRNIYNNYFDSNEEFKEILIESVKDRLLFVNRDKYYKKKMYENNSSIFGYTSINKKQLDYYCYTQETDIMNKCTPLEISLITSSRKKLLGDLKVQEEISNNNLYGYIERDYSKDNTIFKIVDKNSNITGKNCTSLQRISTVKKYILDLYNIRTDVVIDLNKQDEMIRLCQDIDYRIVEKKDLSKKNLCNYLQKSFRYNNILNTNRKNWFYNEIDFL